MNQQRNNIWYINKNWCDSQQTGTTPLANPLILCHTYSMKNTSTMTNSTYQGWKNYGTWNVALYINNEYPMYLTALDWVKERLWYDASVDYDVFRHTMTELFGDKTPDGVSWNDESLDHQELSEMLQELV